MHQPHGTLIANSLARDLIARRRVLSVNPVEISYATQPVSPDLFRFIDTDGDAAKSRRRKNKGWNGHMETALHGKDAVAATNGDEGSAAVPLTRSFISILIRTIAESRRSVQNHAPYARERER